MTNDIQRGPLANALVLHDFKKDIINWKEWFYYIEAWFHRGGLIPNRISGASGKTISYEKGKKRLEKDSFQGIEKDGVWIIAIPPKVGIEMFDYIFAADFHDLPNGNKTLVLCWDDHIIKYDRNYIEDLAKHLFAFLEPAYGYGYQRLFKLGPSFYPFGTLAGIDDFSEEADQITKWGIQYGGSKGRYKTGMLRDIYPINFLSQAHFEHKIEEQSLKTWIESSPNHGELNKLAENLWSWWIPEDKIDAVREKFIPTGLLLSY